MPFTDEPLGQPAPRGGRTIARALLDDLTRACARLGDTAEPGAVHDFRVALRRLRSWERAFRPQLRPANHAPRKLRRRLKQLARATNPSRDATVHVEWLRAQGSTMSPAEQVGLAWLLHVLELQRGAADRMLLDAVAKHFPPLHRRLARRLGRRPKVTRTTPTFATVAAERITQEADALRDALAAVHRVTDRREAHAARIAGKRLRYILEPFAPSLPEIRPVLEQLKALQDAAGDLHDAHLFAEAIVVAASKGSAEHGERLARAVVRGDLEGVARAHHSNPTPGLLAIAARLRERQGEAFERLQHDWLHGGAETTFTQIRSIADTLRRYRRDDRSGGGPH